MNPSTFSAFSATPLLLPKTITPSPLGAGVLDVTGYATFSFPPNVVNQGYLVIQKLLFLTKGIALTAINPEDNQVLLADPNLYKQRQCEFLSEEKWINVKFTYLFAYEPGNRVYVSVIFEPYAKDFCCNGINTYMFHLYEKGKSLYIFQLYN